jgi:hypothetical protein
MLALTTVFYYFIHQFYGRQTNKRELLLLLSLDELNCLLKYADDVTLLNPENVVVSMETEVAHILDLARENKMPVNMVKTTAMIFHRLNPKLIIFPNEVDNIQRVTSFKLFCVLLKPDLNFNDHASSIVTVCNQRLYLFFVEKTRAWYR